MVNIKNHNITIDLKCRITNTEDLIAAICDYLDNREMKYNILSKGSIPIIEVENKKYSAILTSSIGSFVGIQKINLKPIND